MKTITIAIFILLIFLSDTVNAEDSSITGTVLDGKTNEPIVNATVTVIYAYVKFE